MTNHLKSKHYKEYVQFLEKYHKSIRDSRIEEPAQLTKSLGKVKHWSKNKNQIPEVK